MQLRLQFSCGGGLHRSSGLQKAQAIRTTKRVAYVESKNGLASLARAHLAAWSKNSKSVREFFGSVAFLSRPAK